MGTNFKTIDTAVIRFAGDSGDGMQLTGGRFTETTAIVGNDLSTLPDFPAEIRAPAGSLAGVSAFQLKFSSKDIHTPGDRPDVLVAMNPAALKVHQKDLIPGGIMIINTDAFSKKNLKFAGYDTNPVEDGSLDDYFTVIPIEMNKMAKCFITPYRHGKIKLTYVHIWMRSLIDWRMTCNVDLGYSYFKVWQTL